MNKKNNTPHTLMLALILLASTLLTACNTSTNKQLLEEAETKLFTAPDSTLIILGSMGRPEDEEERAYWLMLKVWAEYRNYEKTISIEELQQAFQYYSNSKDYKKKASVYYLRSVVREDQKVGTPSEWTEDMYSACMAIAKTEDHHLAAQIYQRYGVKAEQARNYDEAIKWDLKYLDEARQDGDHKQELMAMINLSSAWLFKEDDEAKAKAHSTDGSEVAKYTQFRHAIDVAHEAIQRAKDYNLLTEEGKVWGNLSLYYSRAQNYDSALVCAIKANEINEKQFLSGARTERVRYVHLADAYRKLGQGDSAIKYALKDVDNPSLITRSNASQQLYIVYRDIYHDYEKSMQWLELFDRQQDSIRNQRTDNVTAGQIKVEKEELQEEVKHTRHYIWWLVIVLVALIVVSLLVWMLMRQRYKRQLKSLEGELNEALTRMHAARNNETQTSESRTSFNADTAPKPNAAIPEATNTDTKDDSETSGQLSASSDTANNTEKDGITIQASSLGTGQSVTPNAEEHALEKQKNAPFTEENTINSASEGTVADTPLSSTKSAENEHTQPTAQTIKQEVDLAGGVREKLVVNANNILYITSEHNYMKVVFVQDGKVQHKLTRRTMTEMETALQPYPTIIRCHRAFMVNIAHALRLSSSSGALYILLRETTTPVPVSRSYIKQVRSAIEGN